METKTIWQALHAAKQELGKVPKDSTNPFFKSKYFDINGLLDVAEPILHKHGLFVIQPIADGKVVTKIIHAASGDSIESELQLSDSKDPQKHGSEITYYRRYTLQSLLAMQADDDDGNAASKGAKAAPAQLPILTKEDPIYPKIPAAIASGQRKWEDLQKKYTILPEMMQALQLEVTKITEAANA
jgi:hypothetical protein